MPDTTRVALYGALITVLALFGGLFLGVVAGNFVFEALPGHSVMSPDPVHITLAAIPAVAGLLAGAAVWGVLFGRLVATQDRRRAAIAGILGFAPITVLLGVVLQLLEPIALVRLGAFVPLHRLFTLLFVPTAFLIAGISAWVLGVGLREQAALRLFWQVGVAAAVAFLAVNLTMEAFGWIVGGPNAAARFTMLTVMFAGNLGAALAGGAVLGWRLARTLRAGTAA